MDALLLRIPDVAPILGISRSSAYALIDRGELPHVRIGARRYVRKADVEAFVAQLEPIRAGQPELPVWIQELTTNRGRKAKPRG
ncbi:MAG: helix-turn-helix domain-containing protein [Chloroflexi bacterium]|nr:helix-turn-helix domain-containing protein [Chloroflexota bacterium]